VEFVKRHRWPIATAGLAVLVLGFLLFRPDKLFVDDVVDEDLQDAFATPATTDRPSATTIAPTTTSAAPLSDEPADAPPPSTSASTPVTASTSPPEPAGPVAVNTGSFFGIDHSAEGTATIYEQDGRYVLRFEDDTDIQNGPDLYVWVLESSDYEGGDPGAYIDLGKIKGNVGGQNYVLPAAFDPDAHRFVLVWCLRFSVPFAGAPLA